LPKDVIALLLFVGWCVLGIVKVAHDVAEYRAQQTAIATFHARNPYATLPAAFDQATGTIAEIPYDPALEKWVIGEALGYVITLAVVLAGLYRGRDRKITTKVKWVASARKSAVSNAAARRRREAQPQSGATAAERLSAIVWTDHVVRREKERA
jgi:hypothetical protein